MPCIPNLRSSDAIGNSPQHVGWFFPEKNANRGYPRFLGGLLAGYEEKEQLVFSGSALPPVSSNVACWKITKLNGGS